MTVTDKVEVFDPLTTLEGWKRNCDQVTVEPAPLIDDPNDSPEMAAARLNDDLEARLDYHSELVIVNTPTVAHTVASGLQLVILNRRQYVGARRGLFVYGMSGTGKTTAVAQLGRAHELRLRRFHNGRGPDIPVIYVTVPPASTARMLAGEFARFLGLPVTKRDNLPKVTDLVCHVLLDVGTSMVIVDEIQNLRLTTLGGESSDQLKYFAERLPATFVYAGIATTATDLFPGGRGEQIAGRFTPVNTRPFSYGSAKQRDEWISLITTFEDALRLRKHQPGSLRRQAAYLHRRTAGKIGSLSHLIRAAALHAILDGTEAITRATLDSIDLDIAAQDAQKPKK